MSGSYVWGAEGAGDIWTSESLAFSYGVGKNASQMDSQAESESFVGAAVLATAPDRVTGPVVRGALSERAANTSSMEVWNSVSLS